MTDPIATLREGMRDRYAIERELGQGGMATVYLARDLRHGRPVALKVLRPELAAVIGAERFLAEIRTTAALQHPHILPLHDSGTAGSFLYYVMPFVDGESLRARLVREKQLPVADALRIAEQVAAALDYAHRHAVIHRDIKPENILLHEGQALVADFGIALAVSQAGSSRLTETGLSLGTPHYMSPEQALGERDITPRSDVYALGTVLYEMLTGEPPFTGATPQAVVAKLLADQPSPPRRHRPTIPEAVEAAILTALEKLPADRFAGAAEFAAALRAPKPAPRRRGRVLTAWLRAGGLLLVLALAAALLRLRGGAADPDRTVRFAATLPPEFQIAGFYPAPVFSRDGRQLALPADRGTLRHLLLLRLSDGELRPIPGTAGVRAAAFSPDGRWLAFIARNQLMKVALDGGTPIALAKAEGLGVAWGDDGTIVYNRKYNTGLWRVDAGGGTPDSLTTPRTDQGELGHWWPEILPGAKAVLFTAYGGSAEQAGIAAVSLETAERTPLVEGGVFARLAGGRLLFLRERNIMAVPFDARRLEVRGSPVPVLQGVAVDRLTATPIFAVSGIGDMAWVPDSLYRTPRHLVWLDGQSRETRVRAEPALYSNPRLSPDGRRLAVTIEDPQPDVWVLDLSTGIRTRLTRSEGIEQQAVWTPDGARLVYQREGVAFDLYARAADASDTAVLIHSSGFDKYPYSMSRDGRRVAVMEDAERERILFVRMDSAAPAESLPSGDFNVESPMISPDGRWLAFASNESGSLQVMIAPFDERTGRPGAARQVTVQGLGDSNEYPWIRWSYGGDELFYATSDSLMALAFDPRSGATGTRRLVVRGPYIFGDVARDGRILALSTPEATAQRRLHVVLGWPEARAR